MKIKSLGLKVSLIVLLVISVLIVIIIINVSSSSSELILDLTAKEARAANVTFATEMQRMLDEALSSAHIIAYSNDVVEAILNDDYEALRRALILYGEAFDVITLADPDGYVLARMHNEQRGDNVMEQHALSTAITTGTGVSSLEAGAGGLAARGSAAILDSDGNIIGGVVCGMDMAEPRYVDYIKEITNSEVTFFVGDMRLSSTLVDETGQRVVGTRASAEIVDTVINQRQELSSRLELFGTQYYAHYSPLIVDNQVVGMLFNGVPIDDALAGQRSMINAVIILGVICGAVGIAVIFIFNTYAVTRPLRPLTALFSRAATEGDILFTDSEMEVVNKTKNSVDEIGLLTNSAISFFDELIAFSKVLETIAGGDISVDVATSSDKDVLSTSLNNMVENLNRMFSEINSASSQVSTGSKQIADGAQSLAQGSTEQSASVQQLSASISEIGEKTRANADMAGRAATLADTIMRNAEKGSRQMDEMTEAVKEINLASQNISKVIKTIDDIAFQTNILALNAAVEAARAGQHGKGFAVVAEEVRNLASKSAGAAKETSEMIQNSMEKAELGARISFDTASSLSDIVSGINESTVIVNEIAKSSEEQSAGIKQINIGIDQVAQVVQQNSATAEESAAASEEMSGQSEALGQLIAQFKLKGSAGAYRGLPPAEGTARNVFAVPQRHGAAYASKVSSGDFGKY